MQVVGNKLVFQEETDTFDLTITFSEGKLTFTLKDFVDWTIYSKEYTQDDVGKDIHKRIELIDVYNAFYLTKSDEENMKVKQHGASKLNRYEFGTIIQKQNLPCYKIEREGKITAYQTMVDARTKKKTTCESVLNLKKLRSMTESEISALKSVRQKNQLFEELNKQIQNQKREKQELLKRIINVEQENMKLRQELNKTKQGLASKIQKLESSIILIQQKHHQKLEAQDQKILEVKQELTEKFQLQIQRSLDKIAELEAQMKPVKMSKNFHNLKQAYSHFFKIDGIKVQYTGPEAGTQYIFNQPINHNQSAIFRIKISQSKSNYIMIGVVDYAKQKDQRRSYSSGNAMFYNFNGSKYPSEGNQGNGFKQGDIVEVNVSRFASTIKYIVNGVLQATHTNKMLAENNRVFMPCVDMWDTNDIVEWLME